MTKDNLTFYKIEGEEIVLLQFADQGIKAGFPSPAQDYLEQLDLFKELIKHPASTFLARINGNSMEDARLHDGDIVIIDKSLTPVSGDKVVCNLDGEFTIKFIEIDKEIVWLVPANPDYPRIKVTSDNDFIIWGVVTNSIIRHRR